MSARDLNERAQNALRRVADHLNVVFAPHECECDVETGVLCCWICEVRSVVAALGPTDAVMRWTLFDTERCEVWGGRFDSADQARQWRVCAGLPEHVMPTPVVASDKVERKS